MFIHKESILNLFSDTLEDDTLEVFYQTFGPCTRSEYFLDGENIVDLDWENFGCIVTLVNTRIRHVRLQVLLEDGNGFNGWLGDGVKEGLSANEIKSLWGESSDLTYPQETYTLGFEFSGEKVLESVVLSRIL